MHILFSTNRMQQPTTANQADKPTPLVNHHSPRQTTCLPPLSPHQKIEQLHGLIQGYLRTLHSKTSSTVMTQMDIIKEQALEIKKEIVYHEELASKPSGQKMAKYYEDKRMLTEEVEALAKEVQTMKSKLLILKIDRKQLEQEVAKNSQLVKQLMERYDRIGGQSSSLHKDSKQMDKENNANENGMDKVKYSQNNRNIRGLKLPNVCRNPLHPMKKSLKIAQFQSTNNNQQSRDSQSPKSRQHFFNGSNFRKLREVKKLLDQITVESESYMVQKLLMRDSTLSIKKVFRNFSAGEYFANLFADRKFQAELAKIQKM